MQNERRHLYLLIFATLASRLPWVFMVPMHEAPDENTHFFIIKYLADNLRLPGPLDLANGGQASVYVPIPQFGYIPHVLAFWSLSWLFDPSMSPRFGTYLLSPAMTICAYWLGKRLFPQSPICALGLPWMIVLHPQLVLVHSYANNDITAASLASILLCLSAWMLEKGLSLKLSVLVGFLAGWLLLTKYTGYAVLPAVALAYLLTPLIHKSSLKVLLANCLTAASIAVVMAFPWFLRNYQLYDGDFMGTNSMRRHWAKLYNKPLVYFKSPVEIFLDRKWWRWMYFSYWAMFGYMTREVPKTLYWTYVGFLAVAFVGYGKSGIVAVCQGKLANLKERISAASRENLTHCALWLVMITCIVANLVAMIWASTGNVGGPQGRYLLTSELPFIAFILFGVSLLDKVWGKRLVLLFLLFNAFVYVYSVAMLYPIYGFRWKTF